MIKFLGKILFPDLPPWTRDVQVKVILGVAAGLLMAGILAGLYIYTTHKH